MARTLHLLPASADYQTETAVAQLMRHGDEIESEVRTLGRGGDFSSAMAGIIALRRHNASGDLIHAWGDTALCVAAIGANQPIIYSPTEFPRQRAIRWLRSILNFRDVEVVCPTNIVRRAFIGHGVPVDRCHLIRPGIEFSQIPKGRDPTLRAALGFGDADQVFLAVGESTRAADHPRAAWASVVLHVLERRNRLLLWGRGPLAEKTARFVQRLEQPELCTIATEKLGNGITFEQLVPAADVALVTGASTTLPIAVCMAAGLPIVAVPNAAVNELLVDRENALLAASASPKAIARRVLDLREDPGVQKSICDRARADANEYFSQSRFADEFRTLYQRTLGGERVERNEGAAAQSPTLG